MTNYPPPAAGARSSARGANEVISVRPNKGTAEQRDGPQGQVLITPPQHAGHQVWIKVIKYKVKVIKCNVRVNEVIEVRSLRVCCCCYCYCYCCCCYYISHVILLDQGQIN